MGLFNRLIAKVRGTSTASALDWKEIEAELLSSDLGPNLVGELLEAAKKMRGEDAEGAIKEILRSKLSQRERALITGGEQKVILVVGVNGTGKTTSVAKLASSLKKSGHSVIWGRQIPSVLQLLRNFKHGVRVSTLKLSTAKKAQSLLLLHSIALNVLLRRSVIT